MLFSRPKCPIPEDARRWVDYSLRWLLAQFECYDLLNAPVVLPDQEFFPDPFNGSEACVQRMLERVCGHMRVDPTRLELALFTERLQWPSQLRLYVGGKSHQGAAGLYIDEEGGDRIVLAIETAQVKRPASLVATMAHELGHVLLLGDGRVRRDDPTQEQLTDLVTVAFGLGVFAADAAFEFQQWDDGWLHGWDMARQGYLSEEMFGYALAVYAHLRGETRPEWVRHLKHNVKVYYKHSASFLWARTRST